MLSGTPRNLVVERRSNPSSRGYWDGTLRPSACCAGPPMWAGRGSRFDDLRIAAPLGAPWPQDGAGLREIAERRPVLGPRPFDFRPAQADLRRGLGGFARLVCLDRRLGGLVAVGGETLEVVHEALPVALEDVGADGLFAIVLERRDPGGIVGEPRGTVSTTSALEGIKISILWLRSCH